MHMEQYGSRTLNPAGSSKWCCSKYLAPDAKFASSRLTDTPPQLQSASYRFDPLTGATTIIDDTLVQPNGIALSPDGKSLYISDTGAETGSIIAGGPPGSPYNQTGPRTVYKYDVVDNGRSISGRRPFYYAMEWIPDGLKVAANGYVVTATGRGVDVLDEYGVLIVRIQTNFVVQVRHGLHNEVGESVLHRGACRTLLGPVLSWTSSGLSVKAVLQGSIGCLRDRISRHQHRSADRRSLITQGNTSMYAEYTWQETAFQLRRVLDQ